jgi:hypothetical protein
MEVAAGKADGRMPIIGRRGGSPVPTLTVARESVTPPRRSHLLSPRRQAKNALHYQELGILAFNALMNAALVQTDGSAAPSEATNSQRLVTDTYLGCLATTSFEILSYVP